MCGRVVMVEVRETWTVGSFLTTSGPRQVSWQGTLESVRRVSASPSQSLAVSVLLNRSAVFRFYHK